MVSKEQIYKAIDEGIKTSLIDFSDGQEDIRFQKTKQPDNTELIRAVAANQVDELYRSGKQMSKELYDMLQLPQCVQVYKPAKSIQIRNLIDSMLFFNPINLNWIDVSDLGDFTLDLTQHDRYSLDISLWDIECIYNSMFGKSHVTNIVLPKIRYIEDFAFTGSSLAAIEIPDSVTYIGYNVFYGCVNLEYVKLPNTLNFIGNYAFSCCSMLKQINFDGTASEFKRLSAIYLGLNPGTVIKCQDRTIRIKK